MRKRHLFWIVFSLAFGLNACSTLQQPPRLDTAKACADWRWIGISRPGGRCPDVKGWTVRPLFAQAALDPKQVKNYCQQQGSENDFDLVEVVQELNRFCVYEIAKPNKELKDLPFPPTASADLVRFDKDCAALSLAGTTASAAKDWRADFDKFLVQAAGYPRPLEINDRLGVRLAFLDTQPTGEGAPHREPQWPHSWHGYTLTHIARQLVCAPGTDHCAAQITTRLALPILKFDPKTPKGNKADSGKGGWIGTQSDLAAAIRDEVDDWLTEWNRPKHLVLNLSLAWDGNLFTGLTEGQISQMQAGTQAVYQALRYARAFDVLVLAAAGNQKTEPCQNTGLLLPAAWEGTPPQVCSERKKERPLLYAVGGVRADGEPLANARFRGMPTLAAYAQNVAVPSWNPNRPTATVTGSSVATAVVSSIAAVVWDAFPDHDSDWVVNILKESGDPLPSLESAIRSDPTARRISLCRALRHACDVEGSTDCLIEAEKCKPWPRAPFQEETAVQGSCQPWLLPQPEDTPRPCPGGVCPPDGGGSTK